MWRSEVQLQTAESSLVCAGCAGSGTLVLWESNPCSPGQYWLPFSLSHGFPYTNWLTVSGLPRHGLGLFFLTLNSQGTVGKDLIFEAKVQNSLPCVTNARKVRKPTVLPCPVTGNPCQPAVLPGRHGGIWF